MVLTSTRLAGGHHAQAKDPRERCDRGDGQGDRSGRADAAPVIHESRQMGGLPTDLISGVRYCIDDDKCRAFEPSAPTADALDSWLTQSAAL
jgi:hypothetical protein